MNRRIAHWALALGLLGASVAQAQDAKSEVPTVIRIGVATGGVGNPIRHGGTSTALVYTDKAIEEEFRKDCIDPAETAQVRLLKHKPQQEFSCPAPDVAAGGCKSQSSHQ